MNPLTPKEYLQIETNLKAFLNNFESIIILKCNKTYYVFVSPNAEYSNYIHYSSSIDYINGWLYGAVQANNKIMKSKG